MLGDRQREATERPSSLPQQSAQEGCEHKCTCKWKCQTGRKPLADVGDRKQQLLYKEGQGRAAKSQA